MRVSLSTSDTCNISLRMNRVQAYRRTACGLILDWNSNGLKFDLALILAFSIAHPRFPSLSIDKTFNFLL